MLAIHDMAEPDDERDRRCGWADEGRRCPTVRAMASSVAWAHPAPGSRGLIMPTSAPVAALTFLGILLVVLGIFAAGNLAVIVVGLLAILAAGVLQVVGARRS